MSDTATALDTAPDAATEVIREVCQQNKTEPAAIWEALEAKGVETTPGVIHQAINGSGDSPTPKPADAVSTGLQAEDLTTLGALATKAGGVEQLIRILSIWHDTTK